MSSKPIAVYLFTSFFNVHIYYVYKHIQRNHKNTKNKWNEFVHRSRLALVINNVIIQGR